MMINVELAKAYLLYFSVTFISLDKNLKNEKKLSFIVIKLNLKLNFLFQSY